MKYHAQSTAFLMALAMALSSVPLPAAAETPEPTTETNPYQDLLPEFAPQLTYDRSPMKVGETRAIHVSHPLNDRVSDARILDGGEDYEWTFDKTTSDLLVTVLKPCKGIYGVVYSDGCTFSTSFSIQVLAEETTAAATATKPFITETTTLPTTAAPTEPNGGIFSVHAVYDTNYMSVGEEKDISFTIYYDNNPYPNGEFCKVKLSGGDSSVAEATYDEKTHVLHLKGLSQGVYQFTASSYMEGANPVTVKINVWDRIHTTMPTPAATTTTTVSIKPDGKIAYGDLNNDGTVDVLDVILVNKFLLGSSKLDDAAQKRADVDGNGKIDTADSLNILKKALEIIETLPVAQNSTEPTDPAAAEMKVLNYMVYPQIVDGLYRALPDDGTWKSDVIGDTRACKYRLFRSADEFKAFTDGIAAAENGDERVTLPTHKLTLSDLAGCYDSNWFATRCLLAVVTQESEAYDSYRVLGIDSDSDNHWTVHMQHLRTETGSPTIGGYLTLIEVTRETSPTSAIKVDMTSGVKLTPSYYNTHSYSNEVRSYEPVIFNSVEDRQAIFPDDGTYNWEHEHTNMTITDFSKIELSGLYGFYDQNLMLYLPEVVTSGSPVLSVLDAIPESDGSLTVRIARTNPLVQDCLMAMWNILVPIRRQYFDPYAGEFTTLNPTKVNVEYVSYPVPGYGM